MLTARGTFVAVVSALSLGALQAPVDDRAAVRAVALDYAEGVHAGDSARHARSIRNDAYTVGFALDSSSRQYREHSMTSQALRARSRPGTATEVQLLEVLDQTAVVRLTSGWGMDYLLLAKFDGRWMITHVLGQSPPLAGARDEAGIQAAARDYIDGFYKGDSTRHVRSVHPSVYKYGFMWITPSNGSPPRYNGSQMPWEGFHRYSRSVRERGRFTPDSAVRGVEILDAGDQVAAVKVTVTWGIDYLLMARREGRWMISHVLWQSPPRGAGSG